jgi:CheY-like chemotaxis protein/tRNA A-37 threonylcarbamoyl transferase component Bud32
MRNVLVVDDNAVVRRHLRGLLEHQGCLVREAGDGLEALASLAKEPWDLVFLDLDMPHLNGIETLKQMAARGIKAPVVLITSSESSSEILSAFKLGAKEYLLKPFREAQVKHALQQVAGLDVSTIQRTPTDIALLDPDEGLAATIRERANAADQVDHAESMHGVPDCLSRRHQLVLVGAFESSADSAVQDDEAETIGAMAAQRDPDAVLVRLLAAGAELPDLTVFHTSVPRSDAAALEAVFAALRSGAALTMGRRVRALAYTGPANLEHLYWWTLRRSTEAALRRMFATSSGSVVMDLSLAPIDEAARGELTKVVRQLAEAQMVQVQFGTGQLNFNTRPPAHEAVAAPVPASMTQILPSKVVQPTTRAVEMEALLRGGTRESNVPMGTLALATATPSPAPLVIPGFQIGELIGEGGMSQVYKATQKSLRRQVAVKVMREEFAKMPALADRFQDEGIALATLRHPNIVSVLDVGRTDDEQLYMVMEYVDGGDLRQLLKKVERIPVAQSVTLATQLLSGLAEAHAEGIIHRDIKPSNVLITNLKDGSQLMKLVDFGIAKLVEGLRINTLGTRQGTVIGTPGYMAPEQLLGMDVTAATDLYAVGVILFEMLTGRRAFVARDEFELAQLTMLTPAPHLREIIDVPVPDALDALIVKLLAKNPKDRPQSAAEVKAQLQALALPLAA